jgi:cyclic pyranopterin phosphate synthase
MVLDKLGRPLRDLRISVTDSCNFRCAYCMPAEAFPDDYPFLAGDQLLSFTEIVRVVEAVVPLGLKKVKLTGGEPLLRSLLPELVLMLKTRFPAVEVGLITNGLHLLPLLARLRNAGLDSVTVSIDALSPGRFGELTGNGHRVETILEAIDAAHRTFGTVKLNTVLLRGNNEAEIEPLVTHFRRPGFELRFIEFMDVGTLNRWTREKVVTGDEVLGRVRAMVPGVALVPLEKRHQGETSERWSWADGRGMVGFINSISRPFCGDCSRVRLGADGRLYTCLFSASGHDLKTPLRAGEPAIALTDRVSKIWLGRSDRYSERRSEDAPPKEGPGKKVEMFAVGG